MCHSPRLVLIDSAITGPSSCGRSYAADGRMPLTLALGAHSYVLSCQHLTGRHVCPRDGFNLNRPRRSRISFPLPRSKERERNGGATSGNLVRDRFLRADTG